MNEHNNRLVVQGHREAPVPALGNGRPIRSAETKCAPRRDHARLLGFDGAAPAERGAITALAVVPSRELGTVEDLLTTVPGPRQPDAREELLPEVEAQWSEVDGHEVDERTFGQRTRAKMTPARAFALIVITFAVLVGSGAWIQVR